MKFTQGDIKRLGNSVRKQKGKVNYNTLEKLQEYRLSHKKSLAEVFNILCSKSKTVRNNSIVTCRIKRFESIITKLDRFPKMQFSRMWDIAGCRCILKTKNDVYKLRKILFSSLNVRKEYDYIKEPRDSGYRAIHLYIDSKFGKVVEIQLRTQMNHNWATLVEITDLLFDSELKEYGKNPDLYRFHQLLSNSFDLDLRDKFEIFDIESKFSFIYTLVQMSCGKE